MRRIQDDSEKELLRRVSKGDETAFKVIFEHYHPKLQVYISGMIKAPGLAEEITMDVFLKLWLAKEMVTGIDNLNSFLYRVAYNKSIDVLRSASSNVNFFDLLWQQFEIAGDLNADNKIRQKDFDRTLKEAISLLSPQRKEVYRMSRERDLSHEQIAGQLQLSPKTINNHIVEAQRFIRNYLSEHLDIALILLLFIRF